MHVAVGVDGTENALAAVRWAARHAARAGLPLRLVHAVSAPRTVSLVPVGISGAGPRRPLPPAGRVLAAAAIEADRYGVTAEAVTTGDPAVPALLRASAGADLLVLGSRDRGRAATVFGSVAVRVTAGAHSPVVVVRGDTEPTGPVVVAVDGSDSGGPALAFAFARAEAEGRDLVAVHAVSTSDLAASPAAAPSSARQTLTGALAPVRDGFPRVRVRECLAEGAAGPAVTRETAGAALVVVGSRGRGPVAGLLLGSTSQALLRAAECPVAVVRLP